MRHAPPDGRLNPRALISLRVVAFGRGPGRPDIEMVTRDLSASGALCESPQAIPLASQVDVRIDLADESGAPHPVVVEALVVRVEGRGPFRVALHFINPPARVLDHLKRFVASALRAAVP